MEVEVAGDSMEVWQANCLQNFSALKEYFTGRNTKLHQRERIRVYDNGLVKRLNNACMQRLAHNECDWQRLADKMTMVWQAECQD